MGTVCSGDSRNPLPRDTEAMPAPLILDAFAHTSPLLMPLTRVPARGELITLVACLALGEQRKEVVSASRPPWSCALSSGSAVPKDRGKQKSWEDTAALPASLPNPEESFELGMAEEGGYDPQSGEEVVDSGVNERLTGLHCMCANAPGPGNSKALELCMQSHN